MQPKWFLGLDSEARSLLTECKNHCGNLDRGGAHAALVEAQLLIETGEQSKLAMRQLERACDKFAEHFHPKGVADCLNEMSLIHLARGNLDAYKLAFEHAVVSVMLHPHPDNTAQLAECVWYAHTGLDREWRQYWDIVMEMCREPGREPFLHLQRLRVTSGDQTFEGKLNLVATKVEEARKQFLG